MTLLLEALKKAPIAHEKANDINDSWNKQKFG